jgi:type IV pilus assembly protein PilA
MKRDLQVKLLQFLNEKSNLSSQTSDGFTLIELLVVIVIIGLLSAIALPTFLNFAGKAKQSEALTYVGSINRGQQAYYLEKNVFGYLSNLELGISNSIHYTYASTPVGVGILASANTTATPGGVMRGYAGRVWLAAMLDGNATSLAIVCEGSQGAVPVVSGTQCPP